jgi:vacuolar fusion protein MON1
MDISEGVLFQDTDVASEDIEDVAAAGLGGEGGRLDDETKEHLREQLRKTLKETSVKPGRLLQHKLSTWLKIRQIMHLRDHSRWESKGMWKNYHLKRVRHPDINYGDSNSRIASRYPTRQYFVLTDAGKPVYVR